MKVRESGMPEPDVWHTFFDPGALLKAFLLARGVECEGHADEPFNVKKMMQDFVDAGGQILACGSCLKLRNSQGRVLCPLSTMKDLYELIRDSDRVVSI